jgi:hypothetical protein
VDALGRSRALPANIDDHQFHFQRCKQILAAKRAKQWSSTA